MAVYVDPLHDFGRSPSSPRCFQNQSSCHMYADPDVVSMVRLHLIAKQIGLKREWFQDRDPRLPHYDLTPSKRALAVQAGAIEQTRLGARATWLDIRAHALKLAKDRAAESEMLCFLIS